VQFFLIVQIYYVITCNVTKRHLVFESVMQSRKSDRRFCKKSVVYVGVEKIRCRCRNRKICSTQTLIFPKIIQINATSISYSSSSSFSSRSCPWGLRGSNSRLRAATHHGLPPPSTFRLVEAPTGSIQDPQCSLRSVFVVVLPAFSLLLSQVKLVWEAFPEAFC